MAQRAICVFDRQQPRSLQSGDRHACVMQHRRQQRPRRQLPAVRVAAGGCMMLLRVLRAGLMVNSRGRHTSACGGSCCCLSRCCDFSCVRGCGSSICFGRCSDSCCTRTGSFPCCLFCGLSLCMQRVCLRLKQLRLRLRHSHLVQHSLSREATLHRSRQTRRSPSGSRATVVRQRCSCTEANSAAIHSSATITAANALAIIGWQRPLAAVPAVLRRQRRDVDVVSHKALPAIQQW